jgi:hypothetical protein
MTRSRHRISGLIATAALVLGCGSALDPVLASKPDYEAYRKTRTADTHEARLSQSQAYLKQHRDGRFRAAVERWFVPAERTYFAAAHDDVAKLRAYLDVLPDGPHAKQAADRIVELELVAQYARRRDERLTDQARAVEEKLSDAAAMRRELVDGFAAFCRHLAGIRSFGRPTGELDHELLYDWRLKEPRARCDGDRCVKALALPYAIPDSGRLAPRQALYDVVFELERGGVKSAAIVGPELFSRVGEAIELRPVRPADLQARAEAIARVLTVVQGAIEPKLSASRCAREAVSPVVLERRCDGVVFRMIAAPSVETDDRIEVLAEAPP